MTGGDHGFPPPVRELGVGDALYLADYTTVGVSVVVLGEVTSERSQLEQVSKHPSDVEERLGPNDPERSPARPHQGREFEVESTWYRGRADVLTFDSHELVATKIRALYQRSKGRNLFDLWLALNELGLDGSEIAACFKPYRPERYSRKLAENNLNAKLQDQGFRNDLAPLVAAWPEGYDLDNAADQIVSEVITHV